MKWLCNLVYEAPVNQKHRFLCIFVKIAGVGIKLQILCFFNALDASGRSVDRLK